MRRGGNGDGVGRMDDVCVRAHLIKCVCGVIRFVPNRDAVIDALCQSKNNNNEAAEAAEKKTHTHRKSKRMKCAHMRCSLSGERTPV